jgi:hypothetical protein
MSQAFNIANPEVKSGTDRNGLVCEEQWKNSGGDSELHGRMLILKVGWTGNLRRAMHIQLLCVVQYGLR